MKTLYFEQITDDRFDNNPYNLLINRVIEIKKLLNLEGVNVETTTIEKIDFNKNIQFRCSFSITKNTKKITWNDIYKLVNSVKAARYKFY